MPKHLQIFSNNNAFGRPLVNSFYTSNVIRQGYTNQAQLMGASIGPGSNSQNLNISLNAGYNKIGFFAERVVYNNDFYHYVYIIEILFSHMEKSQYKFNYAFLGI